MHEGRYDRFLRLSIDRPADRILRLTLGSPGLNAIDGDVHRELADFWPVVDRDSGVRAVLVQGAGKAFSAGGSFGLLDEMMSDYPTRTRVLLEARDLVVNMINCSKPIVSAIHGA